MSLLLLYPLGGSNPGIVAGSGVYSVTGTAAALGVAIVPAGGSYSATGTPATFDTGIVLSGGSYAVTGSSAILDVGLVPAGGVYTFTGTAVSFSAARSLSLASGVYAFTGHVAGLVRTVSQSINITYFGGCPYITEERTADYASSDSVIGFSETYYRQEEG